MTTSPTVSVADLTEIRVREPQRIAQAWAARARRPVVGDDGRLLLVAADHPARGALGVRADTGAMASRSELLGRLATAVSRPGVDGVLGTPDILDDLLLLGALEGKVVIGSMNRGGLQGAVFELDDRFTAYRARDLAANGLDGGKMLTRIALGDPGTVSTLEASAQAITELAELGLMAMVEPFLSERREGRVVNLLDPESTIKSIHIAAGLGASSAHTWLKLPVVDDLARVMDATTLPTLLLGGDPQGDPQDTYARWGSALDLPPSGGSSSAGPCCTRPAGTWLGRSTSPPSWSTGVPMNDNERWVRPLGTATTERWEVAIDHEGVDGWQHTSLYAGRLAEGESHEIPAGEWEHLVVPLSGSVTVESAEGKATLAGRDSVFAGPTDVAYVARDSSFTVTAAGGPARVAVCGARAAAPQEPAFRHVAVEDVPVELRGAGTASREVRNFGTRGCSRPTRSSPARSSRRPATGARIPRTSTTRTARASRARSRRSTTSRCRSSRPRVARPRGRTRSATSGSTAPTSVRSTCSPRCAPATSCSCPTAGTVRPWRPRATTCTTST